MGMYERSGPRDVDLDELSPIYLNDDENELEDFQLMSGFSVDMPGFDLEEEQERREQQLEEELLATFSFEQPNLDPFDDEDERGIFSEDDLLTGFSLDLPSSDHVEEPGSKKDLQLCLNILAIIVILIFSDYVFGDIKESVATFFPLFS